VRQRRGQDAGSQVLDKILKDESEENLTIVTIPDEETNTIYTTMQDRNRETKIKLITQVSMQDTER